MVKPRSRPISINCTKTCRPLSVIWKTRAATPRQPTGQCVISSRTTPPHLHQRHQSTQRSAAAKTTSNQTLVICMTFFFFTLPVLCYTHLSMIYTFCVAFSSMFNTRKNPSIPKQKSNGGKKPIESIYIYKI